MQRIRPKVALRGFKPGANRATRAAWLKGRIGFSLLIGIGSFVALYRFKADVLWVVLAGGLIGLAWTLLRAHA